MLGAKHTRRSGAGPQKGDLAFAEMLVECKETGRASFPLKLEMLHKAQAQARQTYGAADMLVALRFASPESLVNDNTFFIVPKRTLLKLLHADT